MRTVGPECIGCGMCVNESDYFFAMKEDTHQSYVLHQPETEEEIQKYEEIKAMCPVNAII